MMSQEDSVAAINIRRHTPRSETDSAQNVLTRSTNVLPLVDQADVSVTDQPTGTPVIKNIVGTTGVSNNVLPSARSHVSSWWKSRAAVTQLTEWRHKGHFEVLRRKGAAHNSISSDRKWPSKRFHRQLKAAIMAHGCAQWTTILSTIPGRKIYKPQLRR
ncbi:hypothetical protein NPIL_364551 [Nephila pilipes]|uniref:Uncharacterized protein n=1 Tax=Nephila pilipes TaxID=299642 RepID=A0A8X6P4W5_NEPPI|nr:hypothetical protein NPIL_364551 [Nephila pilipes]